MAKLKPSASKKAKGTSYKLMDKASVNKKRKLLKHLRKHSSDLQSIQALKNGVGRTRKTPTEALGWVKEDVKHALGSTVPSRTLARQMAQVLAHIRKIARTSRTKEEQVVWRKIIEAQNKADSSKNTTTTKKAEQEHKDGVKTNTTSVPVKSKNK